MSEEQTETGTGWPQPAVPGRSTGPDPRPGAPDSDETSPLTPQGEPPGRESPPPGDPESGDTATVDLSSVTPPAAATPAAPAAVARRFTSAGAMIALLLGLLGFTLVVQLRTTSTDPTSAATRQEDLVRIFSDLDSREKRLRQDIEALEESQRQLRSGEQGRQAALQEATRRADELGILAGTLPARGPGLSVRFEAGAKPISAYRVLDAVQELRGAGAEAMQIAGGDGAAVRIIASTYFLDGSGGDLVVDGRRLSGPFTITVIGDPTTMATALKIPGGVAASVAGDGGNVIVEDREVADVSALHAPVKLEHARPVS
ncbi:DUF881 domain-containing protein [Micromonospora carbonacea]|jgi:uncharacterized protein YlxW (UPF0749 family)|uniref:Uncharacterized conserved protein YlxW, UPF0749 family n=1 Tax=Micromonospora carbonacea TaxID=47853 RepID=A0A1C4ZY80_9ACTN|nr:DUF881 domain-containing protein [Micromonospora carbonacea]SCF37811.1 Uncharacterized conserved protein YlxW, UPF0749 family [Micromonospora carbonacea]